MNILSTDRQTDRQVGQWMSENAALMYIDIFIPLDSPAVSSENSVNYGEF